MNRTYNSDIFLLLFLSLLARQYTPHDIKKGWVHFRTYNMYAYVRRMCLLLQQLFLCAGPNVRRYTPKWLPSPGISTAVTARCVPAVASLFRYSNSIDSWTQIIQIRSHHQINLGSLVDFLSIAVRTDCFTVHWAERQSPVRALLIRTYDLCTYHTPTVPQYHNKTILVNTRRFEWAAVLRRPTGVDYDATDECIITM